MNMSDTANPANVASGLVSAAEFDARLKRADEARWLASRYAPQAGRERLVAVYLLNQELQRALGVSEPMIGKIRIQWWRETLEGIGAGTPRRHDLSLELARVFAGRADLVAAAHELVDRFDDVIDDHLHAGGHQPGDDHAARHLAAEAAVTRLAGRSLKADLTGDQLNALGACGEALTAIIADVPDAAQRQAQAKKRAATLPEPLWPAIAHIAVARKVGTGDYGPLLKRWRILQAVLTRRL
jgi:phytoene synthase